MYDLSHRTEIAKRIGAIRSAKGITQEIMAELIDASYSTYTKIEHADQNLTLKHLVNIARVLEVSADMILFGVSADRKHDYEDFIQYAKFFGKENLNNLKISIENIERLKEKNQ
jgi:transcriptional regulator with XRE-family HTH domain